MSDDGKAGMSTPKSKRPLTETLLIWAGMVTGLVGVISRVMGRGGVIPTLVRFSLIGLEVQTGSVAVVVAVTGFAVAVATMILGQGGPRLGREYRVRGVRRPPGVNVSQLINQYK